MPRRQTRTAKKELNQHINFEREGEKSSARKWATEVICVQCKKRFTLPFKPRNPEVYCDECFKKKNKKNHTTQR
jgi:CxxC-x17-CxxC domain-containing protein